MAHLDWNTITITDPYMFGTVFRDPELCKELLEMVLNIPIERISFTDEEQSKVPELGAKGIRMDVYAADGKGTVYDIELQNADEGDLAKRSRYYLSANDMDSITRGELYKDMADSFVVFICTFDPFDRQRVRYTVTPHCREDKEEMVDGATRVFVNARAWEKCDDGHLRDFLRYLLDETTGEDEFSKKVDDMVRSVRRRPDWRRNRMKLELYLEEQRQRAIKEGREEGLKEGREEGREEGLKEGLKEGLEETQRLNALLTKALTDSGRIDELPDAMLEPTVRKSLLAEFKIT